MELLLHPLTSRQLATIVRGSGSVVFAGPSGLGRTTAAVQLAQQLNCPNGGDDCLRCRQISAGNFPDHITLAGQGSSIGIAEVEQLQDQLLVRPYYGDSQRIVTIEPAERLTPEAQNRFLKTLEEPPPRTLIILITSDLEALLPTVRSRCQIVTFLTPTGNDIDAWLKRSDWSEAKVTELLVLPVSGPAELHRLAGDETLVANRRQLLQLSSQVLTDNRYRRLLLVPQLLKLGATPAEVSTAIRHQLRTNPTSAARLATALAALDRFARRQAAKVTPKTALEGLMLEL